MKAVLIFLLATFAYEMAECSVANFLADRVLARMSSWVQAEASAWVTLPGYFEGGVVQGKTNDNFTLAFAGPAFELNGSLTRTSEATLIDGPTDPIYGSDQRLTFNVAVKNVTVNYLRVAYNDDDYGFFNLTSMATSDGLSATLSIDLKGSGDSCTGFVNDTAVSFTGALYVTTGGVRFSFPKVIDAVTNHFKTNVPNSIGLLMKTATFNILDGYDICSGVYNPLPQANVMAMRIINVMQDSLNQNMQYWAVLPGFYKFDTDKNGTILDEVVVRVGNFSSIGTLRRLGDATYSNNGNTTLLNFTIESDGVTGVYGDIQYTAAHGVRYNCDLEVQAGRIRTSYSAQFTTAAGRPLCSGATQYATSEYVTGDEVDLSLVLSFGELIPLDVLQVIYNLVSQGFLENINGAAEDFILNLGKFAFADICSLVIA